MKLIVTGGGTGGHVYPALEIALQAAGLGHIVQYFGSERGQERRQCERAKLEFRAFPSEPLYSLRSPRGWKAALKLGQCLQLTRKALRSTNPDVLFSTGGYASAPVAMSARKLGIPYVLHEQNTVPGRTNRMLARDAHAVASVFKRGAEHFPGARVVRTGMPIRHELRASSQGTLGVGQALPADYPVLLVMGGSQGAEAINDAALATAIRMARTEAQWLHVTGPTLFESTIRSKKKLGVNSHYEIKAYLESEDMASALFTAKLALCRSGAGTLAELAAFRKPSVLIPYPHAFGNHQFVNAKEFEEMGAAVILEQKNLQPIDLEARIMLWLCDEERMHRAQSALAEWDVPDAVERILGLLVEAAKVPA